MVNIDSVLMTFVFGILTNALILSIIGLVLTIKDKKENQLHDQ